MAAVSNADDGSVQLNDVTSGRVCLGLWGPRARDILGPLSTDDLSNDGFPFLTARPITVAERKPAITSGKRVTTSKVMDGVISSRLTALGPSGR